MKIFILRFLKPDGIFLGVMINILVWNTVNAQFVSTTGSSCVGGVMTVYGSGCTGGVFEFENASPGTDYEKLYNPNDPTDKNSKMVKWLRPVNNVRARYCQYLTEPFNVIGTPAIPSVTATASKTSVCSSSAAIVTFTSQNTNPGSSPYYRWYVNGGNAISEGYDKDKLQLPESFFHDGDKVMVQVTSQVQCLGPYAVNAPVITMSVTQAAMVSLQVTASRAEVCANQAIAFYVSNPQNVGNSPIYRWYINGGGPVTSDPMEGMPDQGPMWLNRNHWNNPDQTEVYCEVTSSQGGCITGQVARSNVLKVPLKAKQSFSAGIKVLPERQPMNYCEDEVSFQATVMPEGTGIYQVYWYKNGQSVGTNNLPTYKPAAFAQGDVVSVNVIANDDGCLNNTSSTFSTSGAPIITIPRPVPPHAADQVILYNTSATLIADGALAGEEYRWYSDQGALLGTGSVFQTPVLTVPSTTFLVKKYNTSLSECNSNAYSVAVATNHAPIVDAGPDQDYMMPLNVQTLTFAGSGSDVDGTITEVNWSKVSGPSVTLSGTTSWTLNVSSLQAGAYVFRLQVRDNNGATAYDQVSLNLHYPPNNWNYVREEILQRPGVTNEASVPGLPIGERTEKTTYIDGIGRPAQVVDRQQSPSGLDLVQPVSYDGLGREYRKYLPFTGNTNGYYRTNIEIFDAANDNAYKGDAATFYSGSATIPADVRPFAETIYEPSPLNRPVAEYGPGADWGPNGKDKPVRLAALTNFHGTAANQERIIAWKISDSGGLTVRNVATGYIEAGGYFSSGQLSVKQTTDEQGQIVREYTDKNGVLVLKRVQAIETTPAINNDDHWAETYYIYDNFGRLAMVLPPQGTKYAKQALSQH